jgi:hypothetical protein
MQWNIWPTLLDKFTLPADVDGTGWAPVLESFDGLPNATNTRISESTKELYRRHWSARIRSLEAGADWLASYPNDGEFLETIRRVREDYIAANPGVTLDVLYVATNEANGAWWDAFRAALVSDGWRAVLSARDLKLDAEQIEVGQAVDMEIARRAEVFIGNGVRFVVRLWFKVLTGIVAVLYVYEQHQPHAPN